MKFEMLNPEAVERIHNASADILMKTGVNFKSKKALELFAAAGAGVDFELKRVWIPEDLLEKALQSTSGHFRLWSRDGDRSIDLQDGQIRGHNVGGCVRIFDPEKGQARDARRADLQRMTILIDGLENIHVARPVVYPREFPVNMWDIYTAATILQFTDKPYGVTAYSLENLAYVLELTSVIAGSLQNLITKPFIWGSVCPDSPLSYNETTSNILIRYAEVGLPVAIAPCPISGASSPVTLAGTLAQLNAEFLAGLTLAQIVRPGLDLKYTGRPMPMNMRTGNATFGSVEMGMMSAGLVHLSKRYRVCSDSYGLGTRAHGLDEQAAYEKALNGILVALAGADLIAAAGLLADALTSSAEQLVIDNEILGMIFRAVRGMEVSPETLAIELVHNTGPGGNFLGNVHTRNHMRKEYYQHHLVNKPVLEAARETAASIVNSHQPKQLGSETVNQINRIVEQATQSLSSIQL